MDAAIKTTGLTKHYGATVGIEDLDLGVEAGEVFGFLGPNGAGKTTTIRLLLGLVRPTRGTIRLLGKAARAHRKELLGRIGYLPGDLGLYRDLTGLRYLDHFLKLRTGEPSMDQEERLKELTTRFGIGLTRRIGTYSKGMRQIVGIIQAFMHQPDLLILDEPTSGLDPIMQERFYELLAEEKERGATVFLSSHILREAERVCDRVALIKEGRLKNVESVAQREALVGKKVTVASRTDAAQILQAVSALDGVREATANEDSVGFFYSGDIRALIQCLAQFETDDLVCETPDIEEVFMSFYRE